MPVFDSTDINGKYRVATCLSLSLNLLLTVHSAVAADDSGLQQSWWLKFKQQTKTAAPPTDQANLATSDNQASQTSQQPSYFTTPAWFGSQPKAYDRPVEIFRSGSTIGDTTKNNNYFTSLPLVGGYSPWPAGRYSPYPLYSGWGGYLPFAGGYFPGYGLPAGLPGFAWSGLPYSGWSGPLTPGFGYWGSAWGGPFIGSPSNSALLMGAFGNMGGNSRLGEWTPPKVIQTAPGKSSGNYYAPSTVDNSASGSYYATTSPAQTPLIPVNKPTTNFWGPGGSPFPN